MCRQCHIIYKMRASVSYLIIDVVTVIALLSVSPHLCLAFSTRDSEPSLDQSCPVLYLLNVEPYPDDDKLAVVWDKGLELIPSGHLAAEQVNNRSDILPGYELKLVDIDSEACGRNVISKGIVNVFKELVNPNLTCIVGIIGLFCSPVTNIIAPITSHPKIGGYIQLAASTSPVHRSNPAQTNLFHIIGSSSVFNEATIAMMRAFNWHKISSIHDSRFYFRSTADDFVERIASLPDADLVTRVPISDSYEAIPKIFNIINDYEARISYWSLSYEQTTFLLCEAFRKNFIWPGYVYIIQEHTVDIILQTKTSCSKDEVLKAMEGVFLLQYRLFVDNDTELFSGWNYSEFRHRYAKKVQQFASSRNENIDVNVYANSLYDQVWAFAQAMNNSLLQMNSQNVSFADYMIGNTQTAISSTLKSEFKNLSFQGASGWIAFNENQESPSSVNIYQIQNGTSKLVGVYYPFEQSISESLKEKVLGDIPGDSFETIYMLLPLWLGGCILIAQCILLCLITINMVLLLWWRENNEIKASSPILSVLIMVGCYLLCAAPIILVAKGVVVVKNPVLLLSQCNVKTWSISLGMDMIFATLLFRLLRLFHVFRPFQRTSSKYWSDKYLFLYILLVCLGKVTLLVLWSSVDILQPVTDQVYVPLATPPHYQATVYCVSRQTNLWVLTSMLYSGVLISLVMFLAVQTRHIKRGQFKDTKKVNIFIFLTVIVLSTTFPLWIIFLAMNIGIGANICEWLAYFAVAMLCQLCLFTPKILPLAIKNLYLVKERSSPHPIAAE